MRRRTRLIAGLLTSGALLFSLAERAWASTCAPAMAMSAAPTSVPPEMSGDGDAMPGHQEEKADGSAPDCPFGPAGTAQVCTAHASLPATTSLEIAPAPEGATLIACSGTQPYLLIGSTLFHPPRS